MITYKKGNIFTTKCDVIVNTVNCVGVMGAGIAYEFKVRYPEMFEKYKKICDANLLDIGLLWIYKIQNPQNAFKAILNFPTKKDWKSPTKEIYIEEGLSKFVETYAEKNIKSIAFPLLGAGKGGLEPNKSIELMEKYLKNLPITIEIWEYSHDLQEDDFFLYFRNLFLQTKNELIKKRSGLKSEKIDCIKKELNEGKIKNMSLLANQKEIGKKALEKAVAFVEKSRISYSKNYSTNDLLVNESQSNYLQKDLFQ